MVKKKGIVWSYYTRKIHGSQVIASCKFCDQSYIQNATRMEQHIERCPKCPQDIKKEFMELVKNKRAKSAITMRLAERWSMQQIQTMERPQNENPDNANDWEYEQLRKEAADNNVDDIDIVDSKNWNDNRQLPSVESEESTEKQEQERDKVQESAPVEQIEEPVPKVLQPLNKRRRISHLPLLSHHRPIHSFLSSKIQQEQYLERVALRKIAEIEVQRKTLEFKRIAWEHTIEKARNEMRWAHECRMMQLKEELQQQLIEQARNKKLVIQS